MGLSLSKLLRQNLPDAVKFCCNVPWSYADDLADRNGIQILEVQEHELPIERLEAMDQRNEALHGPLLVYDAFTVWLCGKLEVIEAHELWLFRSSPQTVGCCGVVGNSIHPCSNRTPPAE
jgi:hypothetical protein